MSPETLASVADIEGGPRSHVPVMKDIAAEVFAENLRAALAKDILPHARFELVWCELAQANTAYAAWFLLDTVRKMGDSRNVRMSVFEGANHFVSLALEWS